MRWMKLEPIIQSEVNQKEKDKYCILMHIYIWNLGRWYQLFYIQGSKGDADGKNRFCTQWKKERVGKFERIASKRIHDHI